MSLVKKLENKKATSLSYKTTAGPMVLRPKNWSQNHLSPLVMPFILTLLPILVFNAGWHFIQSRAFSWKLGQHRQEADKALTGLTANWETRNQIGLLGDSLFSKMTRSIRHNRSAEYIARELSEQAREFFPKHEFWIFRFEKPDVPSSFSLLRTPFRFSRPPSGKVQGQKFFLLAFQALFAMNESAEDGTKRAESFGRKALLSLFGNNIIPELLAIEQKAVPTRVLFRNRVCWLLWDFISPEGNGGSHGNSSSAAGGYGYFFLVPDTSKIQERAYFLASQGPRKLVSGKLSGFLKVFQGRGGDVLPRVLSKSGLFNKWVQSWRNRRNLPKLEQADFETSPWKMILGKREIFSRMVPNSTHLAVVLLRPPIPESVPFWLFLLDLFYGGAWALLIYRRSFGWEFPRISLFQRFVLLYLFAAALPLSLAIVSGVAYFQETRQTMYQHLKDRLGREIQLFEDKRQNAQGNYPTAFQAALDSDEVRHCLTHGGVLHPGLIPAALAKFSMPTRHLPLRALLFYDVKGTAASYFQKGREGGVAPWTLKFFRNAFLSTLWNKYKKALGKDPPGKFPLTGEEKAFMKGYANFTSLANVESEIEERCGSMDIVAEGKEIVYKTHNFIHLPNKAIVAAVIFWYPADLDVRILQEFHEEFRQRNDDQKLFSFKMDRGRLVPFISFPGIKGWLERKIPEILQGTPVFGLGHNALAMAFPIRGVSKILLGAWASTREIEERLARDKGILALGFLLTLLIIAVLGVLTWNRIGSPIEAVQRGIVAVEAGNLEEKVGLSRGDELGLLTRTFDQMIQGLALRKKFAALVSGKALDALSRAENFDAAVRGRRLQVAVLVSDIRNFTTLCESQPGSAMIDLLNDHFESMSGIIDQWGGRIDRFIGDAIIAVFEAPFDGGGEGPVRAGIEMLRCLEEINRGRVGNHLFSYKIGVGVSRGEVIVGGVGDTGSRFDFAMLGTPVKEGAWLESLSKKVPHFPLVVNQEMVREAGKITVEMIPLPGHEGAFVFPSGCSPDQIGMGQGS